MKVLTDSVDPRALFDGIEHGATEVGSGALIERLIEEDALTFEEARELVALLIADRKLALTPRYRVRLP